MSIIKKSKYFNVGDYMQSDIHLYIVLGQRGDGKTYSAIRLVLDEFLKGIERIESEGVSIEERPTPSVYIRRFKDSFRTADVMDLFKPHSEYIWKRTRGEWDCVSYYRSCFWLTNTTGKKTVRYPYPVMYCASLNAWETGKGSDRGQVRYIIFDEYTAEDRYLTDEYSKYRNTLSTYARDRSGIDIILLGNPINLVCPYYKEYGIDIYHAEQGKSKIYKYPNGTKMMFLYLPAKGGKMKKPDVNKVINIGNTERDSIITGYWDIGDYSHASEEQLYESDLMYTYYINYESMWIEVQVRGYGDGVFVYVKMITAEIMRQVRECAKLEGSEVFIFTDKQLQGRPDENTFYTSIGGKPLLLDTAVCYKSGLVYSEDNWTGKIFQQWLTNYCCIYK